MLFGLQCMSEGRPTDATKIHSHPFAYSLLSRLEVIELIDSARDLCGEMGRYGQETFMAGIEAKQLNTLQLNYQHILGVLGQKQHPKTNQFAMHFSLIISSGHLRLGELKQAKHLLKKCLVYLECQGNDSPLLAACLNNLATIQGRQGKHLKALRLAIQGFWMMWEHIEAIKSTATKNRVKEDVILLVMLTLLCLRCLNFVIAKSEAVNWAKMHQFFNYMGYRTCLRYLGKGSAFTCRFKPVQKEFRLPVLRPAGTEPVSEPKNNGEELILKQLQNIYQVLKSKNNPDVIMYHTHSQIADQSVISQSPTRKEVVAPPTQPSIMLPPSPKPPKKEKEPEPDPIVEVIVSEPKEEPKQVVKQDSGSNSGPQYVPSQSESDDSKNATPLVISEPLKSQWFTPPPSPRSQTPKVTPRKEPEPPPPEPEVMAEETVFVGKWDIKLQLQKERGQKLGSLIVTTSHHHASKNISKHMQIPESRLEKLIHLLTLQDKLPYQMLSKMLLQQCQFIQNYIKPFMTVTDQGQLELLPRSIGLLPPFTVKFMRQECLVLINHVRYNHLRIAVSPLSWCKSVYVNVEMCTESMSTFFSFEEEAKDMLTAIFKSINQEQATSMPTKIKDKTKKCKVTQPAQLAQYIRSLLQDLQRVILEREEDTSLADITDSQRFYYRFEEHTQVCRGTFYLLRYLPTIKSFDVYLQNNFTSFNPEGSSRARGRSLYKQRQFEADFGIGVRSSHRNIPAFMQIISHKYFLMVFDKPLTNYDQDRYVENSVLEVELVQSCFWVKSQPKDGYVTPLRITVVTVNSEYPVGIKIGEYHPLECQWRGYFMHVVRQQWLRPYRKPTPLINTLFRPYSNEFAYRQDYFLAQWLEKCGFWLLIESVKDPRHDLFLEANLDRMVRSGGLTRLFNDDDFGGGST